MNKFFYTNFSQKKETYIPMLSYFQDFNSRLSRPSRPPMYVVDTNLLVLGAARSGTTLLAAMIASHSKIGVLFEDLWGGAGRILASHYKGVKLCVPNQIELQSRWTILDLVLARIIKLRPILPLFRKAKSSKYSISDYLKNPELKVVAILRDVESVTSSMVKRTKRTKEAAIKEWSRAIEVIFTLQNEHPDRIIIVNFNSLVTKPEPTAKKICEFLDVEFEPAMLQAYKHTPIYDSKGIEASKAVISEMKIIKDSKIKNYYSELIKRSI